MSGTLRAGIVGVGFVGRQHVEALRRLGDVEVVAVAASSHDRASSTARSLGVARAAAGWRELIGSEDVDTVHVCVPNDLHREVVTAALGAGKDVICEKPLATSMADAIEMARLAKASGRASVLCHNYRFFAMVAELRARVRHGELGAIHAIRGTYLQDWLLDATDTNWRVDTARGGASRAVADIGTHWIDLAEVTTGSRVVSVMAQLGTVHQRRPRPDHAETFGTGAVDDGAGLSEIRTEDQAALLLRFSGGAQGAVVLSQVAAGSKNALELSIDGARASATWRQERPDQLWIGRRDRPSELVTRDARVLSSESARLAHLPAGHNEGWADALRNLLAEAYAAIRGAAGTGAGQVGMPLPTFDDGVRHIAFVEAALRSAADERWVSIAEVTEAAELAREPVRA